MYKLISENQKFTKLGTEGLKTNSLVNATQPTTPAASVT